MGETIMWTCDCGRRYWTLPTDEHGRVRVLEAGNLAEATVCPCGLELLEAWRRAEERSSRP